jgi:hypothetical protein
MERMSQSASLAPRVMESAPLPLPLTAETEKLAARIERAVRRGTSDKVRELKIELCRDGIYLRGRCGTFYCKQLAQTAAMAIVGKEPLINKIEVW